MDDGATRSSSVPAYARAPRRPLVQTARSDVRCAVSNPTRTRTHSRAEHIVAVRVSWMTCRTVNEEVPT